MYQLFKRELSGLSLICFNWRHVNCIALRTAAKSFLSDWCIKDRILVMLKLSSKKHIWSNVSELSIWSRNPISSAFGIFCYDVIQWFDNDRISFSCSFTSCTMRKPTCNIVALITLSVLSPYVVWVSFKIYLFLVLKWNAFQRPNNKESIVSSQGNSSRMCLKQMPGDGFCNFCISLVEHDFVYTFVNCLP